MRFEKEINLIPKNKSYDFRKLLPFAVVSGGIAAIAGIFLVIGLIQQSKIASLNTELLEVQEEIASYNYFNENVARIEEKRAELQSKKETIGIVEAEKVKILDFLNKLKEHIPSNVRISSLSASNGVDVIIAFETHNTYDIARLIVRLREMNVFESVGTNTLPINDKENTVTFNLRLIGKSV